METAWVDLEEFLKTLGPSRLAAMGTVALGLIGFFVFIMLRFSAIQQVPLYTGLSMDDSAAIAQQLTSAGTAFTLKDNGTSILVDETKLDETRMALAQQGLPAGDSVGYEIFDKTNALGTTSFVQSVQHRAPSRASCRAPSAPSARSTRRASTWCCRRSSCSKKRTSASPPRPSF